MLSSFSILAHTHVKRLLFSNVSTLAMWILPLTFITHCNLGRVASISYTGNTPQRIMATRHKLYWQHATSYKHHCLTPLPPVFLILLLLALLPYFVLATLPGTTAIPYFYTFNIATSYLCPTAEHQCNYLSFNPLLILAPLQYSLSICSDNVRDFTSQNRSGSPGGPSGARPSTNCSEHNRRDRPPKHTHPSQNRHSVLPH